MAETPWEIRPWRIVTLLDLVRARAENFWASASTLAQAIVRLQVDDIQHPDLPSHLGRALGLLNREAEALNLRSVLHQCRRISEYIDGKGEVLYPRLRELIIDVLLRAEDDLGDRFFLVVPAEYADLYEQKTPPFDRAVTDAFPLASEDISEAAKCLALNRPTASVFHLMRAMECAVQALSTKLKIENAERAWGILLSDVSKKIEAMPKGPDRTKWSEIHSHLYHVKEAWRNDTMHPKQTYTFEEAKAIFDAAKVFMNALVPMV
jgi:hypothetical protein